MRAYAVAGVAEQCLTLQDAHGQCIPLLLWAAWAASDGRRIDDALAAQGVSLARPWSDEVVAPLRSLRRRLKSPVSSGDDAVRLPLREKIKAMELDAERALMTALEGIAPARPALNPVLKQSIAVIVLDSFLAVSGAWSPQAPAAALASLTERLTKA